jgi:hypothetical protein
MGGVDGYIAICFGSSLARKTQKWPVRVIKHAATFLATNAKTAQCLATGKDKSSYTNKDFYNKVLREYYRAVSILKKIEFEP